MPTLWERAVFFATGQLPDQQAELVASERSKPVSVAAEIRDHLLGQGLDIMTEWKRALGRASSEDERSELGNFYKNQLGVLNGALDAVRTADPAVTARLDIDQMERAVEDQSGRTAPGMGTSAFGDQHTYSQVSDQVLNHLHDAYDAALATAVARDGSYGVNLPDLNAKKTAVENEMTARQSRVQAEILGRRESRLNPEQTDLKSSPDVSMEPSASLFASQEEIIRNEWQRDLESGRHNEHDLESYFAGRIDQHNTLIEMAVDAHPELQQTLPPPINYQELQDQVQQQISIRTEQQISAQQEVPANAFSIAV